MLAPTDVPRPPCPCHNPGAPLLGAGLAHALHDGCTDTIYVLPSIWQAKFALGFGALAALLVCPLALLLAPQLRAIA